MCESDPPNHLQQRREGSMKPKAIYYFHPRFCWFSVGLMACGGDTTDETEAPDKQTQPTATSTESTQPDVVVGRDIDFALEETSDFADLYAEYALAHGDQDVDALNGTCGLPGESKGHFYRLDVLGGHL